MSEATNVKGEQDILSQAEGLLEGILTRLDIPAKLSSHESDGQHVIEIICEQDDDLQRIVGRRGQVIDALQHVVGKALVKRREERGKPVVIDAGGYRQRHLERLEGLAERMAEKCRASGDRVELSPMNSYDRRVVHMRLADEAGVSTESEGEGDMRHVVVLPAD